MLDKGEKSDGSMEGVPYVGVRGSPRYAWPRRRTPMSIHESETCFVVCLNS